MVVRRDPQRPSGNAEGVVSGSLEFEHSRVWGIGVPIGGSVDEDGADEGFKSNKEGLLLLAPGGASKDFENAQSIFGLVCYCVDVGGKHEVGVKSDTQYEGSSVERKRGT